MSTATLAGYGPSTIDDYDALPEDNSKHIELINGFIVVTSRPTPRHQEMAAELRTALKAALPANCMALLEVEVSFADRRQCLTPDVLVIERSRVIDRPRATANDVLLAVEVVSPGSKRSDRHTKPPIYAAAGIPTYWLVETKPFTLIEHRLVGRWYEVTQTITGDEITVTQPFTMKLDLTAARAATQ